MGTLMFRIMSSKFGFNVEEDILMRIVAQACGCMLLCKWIPVLTLDVLHIAEYPKYVGRLINLAKSGYFSVLSFLQKSTDPASCFCASRSHIRNILHLCNLLGSGLLWINNERPVN